MEIRKDLEALCDIISEQIADLSRKIRNNGMSGGDLDNLDKLTHTLKSIKAVLAMENDGYSSRDHGSYRGSRRDSMGRYSRNDLADRMRELMNDAPDERTRLDMQRMIDKLDA